MTPLPVRIFLSP
jgi:hypothetical protein